MVNEEILPTTRTISGKKELEKIFKMDNISNHIDIIMNDNINSNDTIETPTEGFIDSTDYTNYYVMEAIKDGFLDMEIWNKIKQFEKDNPDKIEKWNKIKQFEKDNPDKIEKWKKEDQERNGNIPPNNYEKRGDEKWQYEKRRNEKEPPGKEETCEEKIIKLCLKKHPKSKFVISVSEYYNRRGRISEKQMDVLKSMI